MARSITIFGLLELEPWRSHVATFRLAVDDAISALRSVRATYMQANRDHRDLLTACDVLETSMTGAASYIGVKASRPYRAACTRRQEILLEKAEIALGRFLLIFSCLV
jgi:hypothetical protein